MHVIEVLPTGEKFAHSISEILFCSNIEFYYSSEIKIKKKKIVMHFDNAVPHES
jgi:hypothetical protein